MTRRRKTREERATERAERAALRKRDGTLGRPCFEALARYATDGLAGALDVTDGRPAILAGVAALAWRYPDTFAREDVDALAAASGLTGAELRPFFEAPPRIREWPKRTD